MIQQNLRAACTFCETWLLHLMLSCANLALNTLVATACYLAKSGMTNWYPGLPTTISCATERTLAAMYDMSKEDNVVRPWPCVLLWQLLLSYHRVCATDKLLNGELASYGNLELPMVSFRFFYPYADIFIAKELSSLVMEVNRTAW